MSFTEANLVFLVAVLGSSWLVKNAEKQLSSAQRKAYSDSIKDLAWFRLVFIAILGLGYYSLLENSKISEQVLNYGYWCIFLAYVTLMLILERNKLDKLGLPQTFIVKASASDVILYLASGNFLQVLVRD